MEMKTQLFAQYWGQPCLQCKLVDDKFSAIMKVDITPETLEKSWFLRLKPLNMISNEDAYLVGCVVNCWSKKERNMDFFQDDSMKEVHILGGKAFAEAIGREWGHGISHPFANNSTDILQAYDILRSKGYALPFHGISVNELIDLGWIKLEIDGSHL